MGKYSGWGFDESFLADADLSAKQYRFVIPASTVGYVDVVSTAGASVLGVLQNDPRAGEEATVRILGTTILLVDSASAASYGKYLKAGSTGQGLGYQSLTASVYAVAMALNTVTSGSGVEIEVLLLPGGAKA